MKPSKIGAALLSVLLVLSLVPTQGLAEGLTEMQELVQEPTPTQEPTTQPTQTPPETPAKNSEVVPGENSTEDSATNPILSYRVNATSDEDPWVNTVVTEPAPEVAADAKPVTKFELKFAEDTEGATKVRVRRAGDEWPETWPDDPVSMLETESFEELQLSLTGELATTHDVWYRVHAGERGWLGWAQNGASAGTKGYDAVVDGVQVIVLAKGETPEAYDAKIPAFANKAAEEQPTEEQPVDGQPSDATGDVTTTEQKSENDTSTPDSKQQSTEDADSKQQPTKEQSADQAKPGATTPTDDKKSDTQPTTVTPDADAKAKDVTNIEAQGQKPTPTIVYDAHVQDIGWQPMVSNGGIAGTSGRSLRVEAMHISLAKGTDGGITYHTHVQDIGWQNWVSDGAQTGTSGQGLRLEAVEIKLTGNVAKDFDVWYRGHVQNIGWQGWVKNGALAGTSGRSLRVEALQITLVPKGAQAPSSDTPVSSKDGTVKSSISYRAHVNSIGWQGWMSDGDSAGTTGMSGRLTGFVAQIAGVSNSELHYSAHVQDVGWDKEVTGGNTVGYPNRGLRVEALKMHLSGTAEKNFDICYRVHVSDIGWLNWAKNGEQAGTQGMSKQVEAVQVILIPKGSSTPVNGDGRSQAFIETPNLQYHGHVQNIGWQGWVGNGGIAGTSGQSLRVEALEAKISSNLSGEIQMRGHVQNIGWQGWVGNGGMAGTSGQSLRVEALQIKLTGELAEVFDIYYRVHAQNVGWLDWASNGGMAGTSALSLRLEAVQILIVPKGSAAPGPTGNPYLDGTKITKLGYQNPAGFYQVSCKNVTITAAAQPPFNYITPSRIGVWATRQECVNAFLQRAREYVGTPYVWNYACAPGVGVDCIGLVYQCAYACGMDLGGGTGYNDFNPWAHYVTGYSGWHSHDAENFWNYGRAAHVSLGAILPGDLISWSGHIAIYMGGDTLIEAYTPGTGVIYSSLSSRPSPRGAIRLFQ